MNDRQLDLGRLDIDLDDDLDSSATCSLSM